jgi:hypothetical protein
MIDFDQLKAKYDQVDYVHAAKWGQEPVDAQADIDDLIEEIEHLRATVAVFANRRNWACSAFGAAIWTPSHIADSKPPWIIAKEALGLP